MKKIQLYNAAANFAFASLEVTDAVALAEQSIAAFKAGGFNQLDFNFWTQTVAQARNQFAQLQNQKLPSELVAPTPPAPMPAASAVEPKAA